ncbi:unnamed protein product [Effrenium voratum]|nr:unnamed protein product [Effrenium voratum]
MRPMRVCQSLRFPRAWCAYKALRRAGRPHVTRVTVIPLDSAVPEEDPKLRFLREEAAKVQLDAEVTDAMLKDLPTQRHMSKTALLQGIRSLHWFQTEAQIRVEHLNEYWDLLENVGWDQARGLLPQDLAEIFQLLSVCKRPSTELVRLMSQQCRLLCRTFGAPEVAQVVRAYGALSFRSARSIQQLSRRLANLLADPEAQRTVTGAHIVAVAGVYPLLQLTWKDKHQDQALRTWKAFAVGLAERFPKMTCREAAVGLNAFARLRFDSSSIHLQVSRLFVAAAAELVPRVAGGDGAPRELALIANAFAKARAMAHVQPLMKAVSARAVEQIESCNAQDFSCLLNAFTQLTVRDPPFFDTAPTVMLGILGTFSPQHLSLTAHAYAKQQVRHEALFDKVADLSLRLLDRFTPLNLANLAYGYGRLQVQHQELVKALADEVIYRGTIGKSLQDTAGSGGLYRFPLSPLERLTQAFARLSVKDQRLYFVLFDMTRQRVREAVRKVKDTTVDGVEAKVDKSRVASLISRGEDLDMPTGHGLSILLSAFAKSQANFHTLVRWVPRQVTSLDGQYSTIQLARMFNACTRLGISHSPMYSDLLQFAKPRVPQMSPRALTMLLRSMARAKVSSRVVIRNALKVISAKASDLDVVDVCASLVACSEMNYRDERFLRLLASVARTRMNEMSGSQLATAFACYAQMRIQHAAWFDAVLFEIFQRQHELGEKDATNVAYAMLLLAAVHKHESQLAPEQSLGQVPYPFDVHQGVLYSMLMVTNNNRNELSYPALYQLQMVELFLRLLTPSVYDDMRQELKSLLAKARKVNVVVDDYMQSSSRLHRRISRWFMRVGLQHRSEVFVGPFMLDMLIGERVVVEIDGPSHFYRDTNTRTASSLLKHLLLRAMGFHVRHLPYQEWQQCGTAVKRTMYCSEFWKDVVAATDNTRLPELVDILDVVVSWQIGEGPHPSAALLRQEQAPSSLPAFYSEELEDEERELLAAHAEAEESLAKDRAQGLSSRDRLHLDRASAKEVEETPMEDQLRELFPRSKRRVVRRSTAGLFDFEAMEAETDSEEEEEPPKEPKEPQAAMEKCERETGRQEEKGDEDFGEYSGGGNPRASAFARAFDVEEQEPGPVRRVRGRRAGPYDEAVEVDTDYNGFPRFSQYDWDEPDWEHDQFDGPQTVGSAIFVRNLPPGVEGHQLKHLFEEAGQIANIQVDQGPLPTATIGYLRQGVGHDAVQMFHGRYLLGYELKVTPKAADMPAARKVDDDFWRQELRDMKQRGELMRNDPWVVEQFGDEAMDWGPPPRKGLKGKGGSKGRPKGKGKGAAGGGPRGAGGMHSSLAWDD